VGGSVQVTFASGQMSQQVSIPDANFMGVVQPAAGADSGVMPPESTIERAIDNPIGAPRLEKLLRPGSRVSILVDDITRPTPTRQMLAVLLPRLASLGVPDARINITIACGLHRKPTQEEQATILGPDVAARYDVGYNDARAEQDFTHVFTTSSNTPVHLNKRVRDADLLIALGVIKCHAFAGFTGGAKSIIPGVSSRATILSNHRFSFIEYPNGLLGDADACAARRDMEEAAQRLPLFIVNAVRDIRGQLIGVFAGHVVQAHRAGVKLFRSIAEQGVDGQADIVLLEGGYSSRMHLYQAIGSIDAIISTRKPAVKTGGTVVLFAECRDGMGTKLFHTAFSAHSDPASLLEHMRTSPAQDDQWSVQRLAFFLTRIRIGMVSSGLRNGDLSSLGIGRYDTMQQALDQSLRDHGAGARVLVIKNPDFLILNAR
jgi:nickel-dependent lactate racemase